MAQITGGKSVFTTQDCWLAAALITLGCAPYRNDATGEGPIQRIASPQGELCFFLFADPAKCDSIAKQWGDIDALNAEDPEHPLCYLHAMMHNRQRLLDAVKQRRRLIFKPHPKLPNAFVFATEKEITR
jgi:hypothetical protein